MWWTIQISNNNITIRKQRCERNMQHFKVYKNAEKLSARIIIFDQKCDRSSWRKLMHNYVSVRGLTCLLRNETRLNIIKYIRCVNTCVCIYHKIESERIKVEIVNKLRTAHTQTFLCELCRDDHIAVHCQLFEPVHSHSHTLCA